MSKIAVDYEAAKNLALRFNYVIEVETPTFIRFRHGKAPASIPCFAIVYYKVMYMEDPMQDIVEEITNNLFKIAKYWKEEEIRKVLGL